MLTPHLIESVLIERASVLIWKVHMKTLVNETRQMRIVPKSDSFLREIAHVQEFAEKF